MRYLSIDLLSSWRFTEYRELDIFLDHNPNITPDDIYDSYNNVLLSLKPESKFPGLDSMVKKAMEETSNWVNWILSYVSEKFITKKVLIDDFLEYCSEWYCDDVDRKKIRDVFLSWKSMKIDLVTETDSESFFFNKDDDLKDFFDKFNMLCYKEESSNKSFVNFSIK